MTLIEFLRILASQLKWMLLAGFLLAAVVYYGTRNEQKEYSSHTLINTGLVSGYNLESSGGGKVDYAFTNNEIENLISMASSYESMEALSMQLLAQYIILDEPDPNLITLDGWEEMKAEDVHEVRKLVKVEGDWEMTLANIQRYRQERQENPVQLLIYSDHPFFGVEHLQTLEVLREGKSDQLRFKYTTTDPSVCRYTLEQLTRIFIDKHRFIKETQSTDVLEFFERSTKEAQDNLDKREDRLLNFMVGNKIINYYEQTRYIAAAKEDLDEMYFKELMSLAGADSTLKRLELEMEKQVSMPVLNTKLVMKRDELSKLTARIAEYELFDLDNFPADQVAMSQLKQQSNKIRTEIKKTAEASFSINRTPEGVEVKNLVTQWLNQVMDIEQAVARLGVLKIRKQEFEVIYSKFAPWGSSLKRMEREIDVAERAYLENLHSYNQARLHQYNMMMSANLKVIDQPFLPVKPAASKRMMLVVVSFMAGFILTLGVAIALELLDGTLKTPLRASEHTQLEVVGAFPKFPESQSKREKVDFKRVRELALGQFLQQIKLYLRQHKTPESPSPHRVAVLSSRPGEGKSYLMRLAVGQLRASGERVAYLSPEDTPADPHPDDFHYQTDLYFFEKKTEENLIANPPFQPTEFDYIFFEIPGLLTETYPVDLLANYDLSLLVARANRTWNHADAKALATYSKVVASPPKLVVNGLKTEALEDSLGEIPKRRSWLRVWTKRIILFDFSPEKYKPLPIPEVFLPKTENLHAPLSFLGKFVSTKKK